MKKTLFSILLALTVATPVRAQTVTAVQPGDKFQIAWDYSLASMTQRPVQFRLYLDNVVIKNFLAADVTEVTTADDMAYTTNAGVVPSFTTTQVGSHNFGLTAYDTSGESTKLLAPVTVAWSGTPKPPSNFTIKVTVNPVTNELMLTLVPTPTGGGQ